MKKRPHPTIPGPLRFVTAATHKRIPIFRSKALCKLFFITLQEIRDRFPYELFAYVLLPDHFHLLVRPADGNISRLMQKIKSLSARKIVEHLKETQSGKLLSALRKTRPGRREHHYQIYQQSFRELILTNSRLIHQKIEYIHKNPLGKGLAEHIGAYSWSSCLAIYERSVEPIPVDPLSL